MMCRPFPPVVRTQNAAAKCSSKKHSRHAKFSETRHKKKATTQKKYTVITHE